MPLRPFARDDSGSLDYGRKALSQEENVSPDHLTFARPYMVDGEYWLKRAVISGLPAAKTNLGKAKLDGITMPLDVSGGLWNLTSAACSGDQNALVALSQYWKVTNPFRSWVFLEIAAKSGHTVSQEDWAHLEAALNPRLIGKAKQIAQDWCPQS